MRDHPLRLAASLLLAFELILAGSILTPPPLALGLTLSDLSVQVGQSMAQAMGFTGSTWIPLAVQMQLESGGRVTGNNPYNMIDDAGWTAGAPTYVGQISWWYGGSATEHHHFALFDTFEHGAAASARLYLSGLDDRDDWRGYAAVVRAGRAGDMLATARAIEASRWASNHYGGNHILPATAHLFLPDQAAHDGSLVRSVAGVATVHETPTPAQSGPFATLQLGAPLTPDLAHNVGSEAITLPFLTPNQDLSKQTTLQLNAQVDWLMLPEVVDSNLPQVGPEIPAEIFAPSPTPVASTSPEASPSPSPTPSPSPAASDAPVDPLADEVPLFSAVVPLTFAPDGLRLVTPLPSFAGRYVLRVTLLPADPGNWPTNWTLPSVPLATLDVWGLRGAQYAFDTATLSVLPRETLSLSVGLRNTGLVAWTPAAASASEPASATRLVATWIDAADREWRGTQTAVDLAPGDTAAILLDLVTPTTPGVYQLRLEVVDDTYGAFSGLGSMPLSLLITVGNAVAGSSNIAGR